ncbi:hypothetical protein LOTGIDRAFT_215949 [Lottia gigantea]|uniref:Lipase domain-containing protein n=1 Tax=Lottia gigantea TaxID=225164 RepID=V3ZQ85_LOTGI|nr:hypothetical protein LOTGIDRAFT_215949 [Lottia gigantea]ESO93553.1 hypothetical protein LOTGIDRAFT_215949 [Lottia gigantea]
MFDVSAIVWLLALPICQGFILSTGSGSERVCFGELGCFDQKPPFRSSSRPFSVLPKSPADLKTQFLLRTRATPTSDVQEIVSDAASVQKSHFDGSKKTKFLVHGFTHHGKRQWLQDLAAELLRAEDVNVIIVDWGNGAGLPYDQASSNTRVVGAQIAQLINAMIKTAHSSPDKFHIIGHSLGAHVSGYAGERVKNLGRISGLDPAGPYFEGTPPKVRLDPTDAVLVDNIHANGAGILSIGMGTKQAMGDVDFYPNGGAEQPGCDSNLLKKILHTGWNAVTLGLYGAEAAVSCSHERSYYLYTETINSVCPFKAFPCANFEDFDAGKCLHCNGNGCSRMGYHADKSSAKGSLYLETKSASTYCGYHYQVNITADTPMDGEVHIQLHGTKQDTDLLPLTKGSGEIKNNGDKVSHLVVTRTDIGNVTGITVKYDKTAGLLTTWMYPDNWKVMGVSILEGKTEKTSSFCAYGKSIKSHSQTDFKVTGQC